MEGRVNRGKGGVEREYGRRRRRVKGESVQEEGRMTGEGAENRGGKETGGKGSEMGQRKKGSKGKGGVKWKSGSAGVWSECRRKCGSRT